MTDEMQKPAQPIPVPQAAWAALERLQLAAVEEKARA